MTFRKNIFSFDAKSQKVLLYFHSRHQLITESQIANYVNAEKRRLSRSNERFIFLNPEMSFEFIGTFIASLEIGHPICLGTRFQFQHLLGKVHLKTALILSSSGTTGSSKLIQLSRDNILANIRAVIECLHFNSITEQNLFLPVSYSFGLLGQLLPALYLKKKTILFNDFHSFLKFCRKSGNASGMISGTPSHMKVLSKLPGWGCDVTGVTHLVSAGDRLEVSLRTHLARAFKNAIIYNNYGLTEGSPRVLCIASDSDRFFTDVDGWPVGDWKCRVNRDGELLISGPQLMLGYLGHAPIEPRARWFNTKYLAASNRDGTYTICGRNDSSVKLNGVNFDLAELRAIILDSVPNAEVVLHLDTRQKNKELFVFIKEMKSKSGIDRIQLLINDRLSSRLLPARILLVKSIPLTKTGKTDLTALLRVYRD